ncbi:hypothetical protein Q5752_004470 [Cryptotrichosporon argae]
MPALTPNQSLVLTALATAAATTTLLLSYQALRREVRTERLKKQVGDDVDEWERGLAGGAGGGGEGGASGGATPEEVAEWKAEQEGRAREWKEGEFDEALIREQLTRNYNFFGEEPMAKIRAARVVVVGCGGVGSWCALMLLRSGVSKLRLIDFDLTTLSSLNRHACATLEDVGSPKVIAMQKYFRKIAPWADVEVEVGLWRKGEGEAMLEGADWVVDAIDNIDTKVDLLAHCKKQGIKVFSSMGAGAKQDPTRVQIADISNTYEDPLARSVRRRLRLQGVPSGVPVVYSSEVPGEIKLLPLPEEEFAKGSVKHLSAFDDFRVRILPVLGPLPAIFGLTIATYILLALGGRPLADASEIKNRKKLYASLERNLAEREARWQHAPADGQVLVDTLPVSQADVGYVFEDLHRGRTTFGAEIVHKPALVRWDRARPCRVDNLVVMTRKEADTHERECLRAGRSLVDVWGADDVEKVERRAQEARRVEAYRYS